MIDAALQPVQRRLLKPLARRLAASGVQADHISIGGFALGLAAVAALTQGEMSAALVLLGLNRLADGLDGAVARILGPTARGAFLDISLDFVFYALYPLGFALWEPSNALPAAVLIAAFMGTGSSFLAFAAVAAKRGDVSTAFPRKGIYYLGGLTEGFETILVFCAMTLRPDAFAAIAYVFALACAVTTLTRWRYGWTSFAPVGRQAVPALLETQNP